jgi:Protein of unknown function (DUF3405).
MNKQQVILILTRNISSEVLKFYDNLRDSLQGEDIFILLHWNGLELDSLMNGLRSIYRFETNILTTLNFRAIGEELLPGNTHFALLKFYQDFPSYKYYWVIEDDIRFSGDWDYFFRIFNLDLKYDFISSHIRNYNQEPFWYWWSTLFHEEFIIPNKRRLRSFNPIYRISNMALKYIKDIHVLGWMGHYEVLFPTMLTLGNYKLLDFGGDGDFVKAGFENRFYTSESNNSGNLSLGTMRFRPILEEIGTIENKLYHPVKKV